MSDELSLALRENQVLFHLDLADGTIASLAAYHALVMDNNLLLHLVAPCSDAEFATRHILESLTLTHHLPLGSSFADVGTGAGLPAIPCLLARPDLTATLIEAKEKKAAFLKLALDSLGLSTRATIKARQFAEVEPGSWQFVAARALDKYAERLPRLLKWADGRPTLLFGGESLRLALERAGQSFTSHLMPLSDRRYLFARQ